MNLSCNINVSKEDYIEVLGFTSFAYLSGKIAKISRLFGGKRSLGEFLENFIYGKIAEIAFRNFLQQNFKIETLTDLDFPDFILGDYLPDIVAFKKNGSFIPLNFWIEIKEVRREQKWFLIPASSIRQRPYDCYVGVWVGLPDEHLMWLMKKVPEISKKMTKEWISVVDRIANEVEKIPCKIIGFVLWEDIKLLLDANNGSEKAKEMLNKKFGEKHWRYFQKNKSLFEPGSDKKTGTKVGVENAGFSLIGMEKASNWKIFKTHLLRNERHVDIPVPFRKKEKPPEELNGDRRDMLFNDMKSQIEKMLSNFKTLKRRRSWFSQPID